jgi:hypothetical protein
MLAQLEIPPPATDRFNTQRRHGAVRNLVLVASEPTRGCGEGGSGRGGLTESSRARPAVAGPNGLQFTRVAAHTLSGSAAWCRRRGRQVQVSPRFAEPIGAAAGCTVDLPDHRSGILQLLDREPGTCDNREAIAAAIAALRTADAVVAGPISPDDANSPGLLPHLADLARGAYRALRPPRELVLHPAFAQVARRFQYIQMSHREARALGAGARDIGILAQRLRRLQGDPGEFAITNFSGHGLLWADESWLEIDPIADDDTHEELAASVFCMAWIVARRFRRAGASAAHVLAYARGAAATVLSRVGQNRNRLPSE